jgi:hypothetical protein
MEAFFRTAYYLHMLIFIILATALLGRALLHEFLHDTRDVRRQVLEQTMPKPMR